MTHQDIVLNLLRSAKIGHTWVTIGDFLAAGAGTRFGGRIFELRRQGHQIEMKYFGEKGAGDYRYALRGEPGEAKKKDVYTGGLFRQ